MEIETTPTRGDSWFTRRVVIAVAIVTVALLAGWAFYALLTGMLVIFAGVLFGVFLGKLSDYVSHLLNVRYNAALAIVVTSLLFLTAATFYFMGSQINQQVNEFSEQFAEAVRQVRLQLEQQGWLQWFNGQQGQQAMSPEQVISTAQVAVINTISALGGLVLVLFLGFYFASQSDIYRKGLLKLVPFSSRSRVEEVLDKISQKLWQWILGRLVGMLLIGVGSAIGLGLLGVPMSATLGVIAGLLTFVPNIGPIIAAIPAVLFGLQQGTDTALYVAGFYFLLQFVESYFITPLIDQQQVSLPPGLILGSQLLFGMLAGILGLIVATPLTVVIYILVREFYVEDVLGDRA